MQASSHYLRRYVSSAQRATRDALTDWETIFYSLWLRASRPPLPLMWSHRWGTRRAPLETSRCRRMHPHRTQFVAFALMATSTPLTVITGNVLYTGSAVDLSRGQHAVDRTDVRDDCEGGPPAFRCGTRLDSHTGTFACCLDYDPSDVTDAVTS